MEKQNVKASAEKKAGKQDELVIMAVGDVYVNRKNPPSIFSRVASVLRQGDVVVANLEGAICDRGEPVPGKVEIGSQYLRSDPAQISAYVSAGFNLVALSNNHIMDYGPEGLAQTMEILAQHGVAHAGGGRNLKEAHRPAIVQRKGVKVALLSYTSICPQVGHAAGEDAAGLATIKVHTCYEAPDNILYQPGYAPIVWTIPDGEYQERMLADVRAARKKADIVLVALHGGISWGFGRPAGYLKELSRAAIDAGADYVMCAHPHSIMGMEMYKSKLISYCMGNFVMDGVMQAHFGSDSMIVKCHVRNGRITRYSVIPVGISKDWQPYIHARKDALRVMATLEAMSQEYGTTYAFEGGEIVIGGPRPGTPPAQRGLSIEPHRGLAVLADSSMPIPSREMALKLKLNPALAGKPLAKPMAPKPVLRPTPKPVTKTRGPASQGKR